MIAEASFITGMMLGLEYVEERDFFEDSEVKYLVIDLLILRLVFTWGQ